MPLGLKRYQQEGDDHFITFSCYHRKPYLNTPASKDIFLDSLERIRTGGPYIRRQLGCPTHAASLFSLIAWVGHSRKARTAPPTSAYPGLLIRTPKIIGDFTATLHTRYPKSHDL